jgi:hypothetical protein
MAIVDVDVYVHPAISWLDPRIKDLLASFTPVRFKDCENLFDRRPGEVVVLSLSGDKRVAARRYFEFSCAAPKSAR